LRRDPSLDIALTELHSARSNASDGAPRLRTPPHHRFEARALPLELRLRGLRPGVYHAVDFIAPRLAHTPVVATVHDLAYLDRPADLAPDALRWYRRLAEARRWTDAWIVPSQWTATRLTQAYDIDPATINVIPHGVSSFLGDAPPLPRAERGDFILAVGTVEPRKRYELLLDALGALPDTLRLVVAGATGWNAGATEARLRLLPNVEWREQVDDDTLRELYRRSLAVVVPSWAEGFGLSALEAFACGTPVISSGGGALAEVTGEAVLTPEPEPRAWAEAIVRLAEDTALWQQLSVAGLGRARQFTWRQAAARTAAVYHRIAGEHSAEE